MTRLPSLGRAGVVYLEKEPPCMAWNVRSITNSILNTHVCLQYHCSTLFPKRNATLISRFLGSPWTRVSDPRSCPPRGIVIRSIVEMAFGLRFTDLHSSPKNRQLQKSCVSFGEECILTVTFDKPISWKKNCQSVALCYAGSNP